MQALGSQLDKFPSNENTNFQRELLGGVYQFCNSTIPVSIEINSSVVYIKTRGWLSKN